MQNEQDKGSLTDKFRDFGALPSEGLWESIAGGLDADPSTAAKRKKVMGPKLLSAIAGFAAASVIAAGLWLTADKNTSASANPAAKHASTGTADRTNEQNNTKSQNNTASTNHIGIDSANHPAENIHPSANNGIVSEINQSISNRKTSAKSASEQKRSGNRRKDPDKRNSGITEENNTNDEKQREENPGSFNHSDRSLTHDHSPANDSNPTEKEDNQPVENPDISDGQANDPDELVDSPADNHSSDQQLLTANDSDAFQAALQRWLDEHPQELQVVPAKPKWMVGAHAGYTYGGATWSTTKKSNALSGISASSDQDGFYAPPSLSFVTKSYLSAEANVGYRIKRFWLESGLQLGSFSSKQKYKVALSESPTTSKVWSLGIPISGRIDFFSRNRINLYARLTALQNCFFFGKSTVAQQNEFSSGEASYQTYRSSAWKYNLSFHANVGMEIRVMRQLYIDIRPECRYIVPIASGYSSYRNTFWYGLSAGAAWKF